jgi:hypothetical protein
MARHDARQAGKFAASRAGDEVQRFRLGLPVQGDHPAARNPLVLAAVHLMVLRTVFEQPVGLADARFRVQTPTMRIRTLEPTG